MSLSDKIRHLIKARSTALHMQHTHSSEDGLGLKKSIKQQDLEAFVDQMMKKEAKGNENEHDLVMSSNINQYKRDLTVLKEENDSKYERNAMDVQSTLSQWEMQIFEQENKEMVKWLEEEHKEVVAAEQKTADIVELLSMFGEHVASQEGIVTNIEGAISGSLEDLEAGNKELEKAQKRGQETRTVFITVVLTLAFSLWFLDWYKT